MKMWQLNKTNLTVARNQRAITDNMKKMVALIEQLEDRVARLETRGFFDGPKM